jgi:predicted  nucleic acid-binding Zn-ribbon protein
MKNKNLLILLLSASAFAVGCDKETTPSQQLEKVQAKTEAAAQDMKDYSYAQRSEYVKTTRSELTDINKDLDQLSAKLEKSSDAVKAEAKPKLQKLRDQTAKLNEQLDKVGNASESTWEETRAGFKKGYRELKDSFQQARQWLSDKIAP